MVNNNSSKIITDPIFQRLVQPLDDKALKSLRKNLIKDPTSRIVQTWNGYHLQDYEKYNLCNSLGLSVQIKNISFPNHEHAGVYLCSTQLQRTDLTNEYRKYLIGEWFTFEEQKYSITNPGKTKAKSMIAFKIGEQINLAGGTVLKYNVYALAMNIIFDQSTDLALRILTSKTRVSHENIIELSRLTPDELKNVARVTLEENTSHLTFSDIRHEVKNTYTQAKAPVSRRERKEQKGKNNVGIRQMPAYDPDSDVNSLCMTISSWVSSIERVNGNTDFSSISNRAMLELMKQLTILESTIRALQKALVERTTK